MSKRIIAHKQEIVIGVDVSDSKHNICVLSTRGEILHEQEIKSATAKAWRLLLDRLPQCSITVVYESGPQGYTLHDTITRMGHRCVVIAPVKTVGIKTDKRDARRIGRDQLSSSARVVTVPSEKKRCQRQVLRLRNQMTKDITRITNRISALKRFHGLIGSLRAVFGLKANQEYLDFCIAQQQDISAYLKTKRDEIDVVLDAIARDPDYSHDIAALTRIKGIGRLTALEVVLNVADIRAFATAQAFSGYCGLCPGEWSTGQARRQGHITRRGPGRLRGVFVQSAWVAVRHDPVERHKFEQLKARCGKKKAIVAIARRQAVKAWRAINRAGEQAAA